MPTPPKHTFRQLKQLQLSTLVIAITHNIHAQAQLLTPSQEIQRAKERTQQVQEQQPKAPDVRIEPQSRADQAPRITLPLSETPNFTIKHIELIGENADQFQFALNQAIDQTGLMRITTQTGERMIVTRGNHQTAGHPNAEPLGVSLGAQGVNVLMSATQNAIINRGYTTTRVLAQPQDLKNGTLQLTVIPGRIRHIQFDQTNADKTHVNRAHSFNAIPAKEGDILNLRDIEMGLENLKRVPTVEAGH